MEFDRNAGVYRNDDGTIVSRGNLLLELEKAQLRLERELEAKMSRLVTSELARQKNPRQWERSRNRYTIETFQNEAKAAIKEVTMQMALLGAGGKNSADSKIYGTAGAQLKKNYQSIAKLGEKLEKGELTTAQAIDRARRLSLGTRQAFHRAEQIQRARDGFMEGWRQLTGGVRHCPDCPTLQTEGWVPIDQIVPIGMLCVCSGRCKCFISYRRVEPAQLEPIAPIAGGADTIVNPVGSDSPETIASRTTKVGRRGTRVTSRINLSGGTIVDKVMKKHQAIDEEEF